jgi:serine/threonine protein kinase
MARTANLDTHDTRPRNLGRYHLYGELASGGMATVHLGRQVASGGFAKMVAIKRLHPQFGKMDEFVEMFLAEARLAARIRHPNVVQPLDVLRIEDEVFLVMEYVEGDSLSRLMKGTIARQEKVPVPIASAILSGVLRGLHAAHEAKSDKGEPLELVHRDISPQNVLVGIDGSPRVIDFGIAKAADSVQITREGELKGKLAYMAPELLSGRRGTRRADIYAAAVVLWEVLTSQRLFDADYQSAILNNILHRPVERPSEFAEGLSPQLDEIVMKGLARDPSDRFATAREMAQALEEAAPPATSSVVGEWVEIMAGASLAKRAARIAEIESQSVTSEVETAEVEEVKSDMVVRVNAAPASLKNPTLPTLQGIGAPAPQSGPRPVPPPPPAMGMSPTLASPMRDSFPSMGSALPPPTITVDDRTQPRAQASAPAWPVPGIAPSAPGDTVQLGPRKRSSGSGIVTFILFVALMLAVTYVGLPEFLKRKYIGAAARQGVTLSIDTVRIGMRKAEIVGATATLNELPGVTLHVQTVELAFSYALDPIDAVAHEALLSLDGSAPAVKDGLRKWEIGHDLSVLTPSTLGHFSVEAGHVVWARVFGEGTRVEAENFTLDVARSRDGSWDDLNLASPLLSVTAPWGRLGPWVLTAQGEHGRVKSTLALDPSGASRAMMVVSLEAGSVTALDVTVPRSNVTLLGISSALLGRRPDDPLFLEGAGHYAAPSQNRVQASVHAALNGARLTNAPGEADAQLDAQLDGDPSHPVDITAGLFAFGPFRGRVTGGVTFGASFVRADLLLRTGGVRCGAGADVALGGGILLDSRNLGESRLVVSPSAKCGLKILPL